MNRKAFVLSLLLTLLNGFGWAASQQDLLDQVTQATSTPEKVKLYNQISEDYREKDPRQALFYGLRAARLANLGNDRAALATAYYNISIGHYWLNNLKKSSEYTYRALALREQLHDSAGMASGYIVIGNILRQQKDYQQAIRYFLKARALGQRIGIKKTVRTSLNNLGVTYVNMGQLQTALQYYRQVKEINNEIGKPEDHALNNLNLGNLYFLLGEKELAHQTLKEALSISLALNNQINKIFLYRILAQIQLQEKQYAKALELALQSLKIAQKLPSPEGVNQTAQVLNRIYLEQADFKNAHRYLALQTAYQDTLLRQERQETTSEISTSYELEKAEAENERLRFAQVLQQEKLQQKEILQFATAVLLLLASALAYVFLTGRNRAKKANDLLAKTNQLILSKNEDIRQQKLELEKLNLQKNKLFSIVAHDLRSPLISLRSLLQLISMGTLPPEKLEKFLKELDTQQQNTLDLLDNLLVWAKIQMEGVSLTPEPIQVRPLVEDIYELFRPQAQKKKIQLHHQIPDSCWGLVDEETIKLVIRNLVSNAIKFCRAGDSIEISCDAKDEHDQWVITVKDCGVGISAENQRKLFGPNHFKERGTANESGNGLGLMLCKEFIEKNGGQVWLESEINLGTSFFFTIPATAPLHLSEQTWQTTNQLESIT